MPDTTKLFFVMTDASLTASGGILMQKDSNGDLHPCTYHSATFSPAEQNYDIYDRELLAVIQALKEWHHYLMGTEHPVTVCYNPFSSSFCFTFHSYSPSTYLER